MTLDIGLPGYPGVSQKIYLKDFIDQHRVKCGPVYHYYSIITNDAG